MKVRYEHKTKISLWNLLFRVGDTKTDILDSFYNNFYNFYTNEMGIVLKHSFPNLPNIMYVFLSFWISIHLFFSIF